MAATFQIGLIYQTSPNVNSWSYLSGGIINEGDTLSSNPLTDNHKISPDKTRLFLTGHVTIFGVVFRLLLVISSYCAPVHANCMQDVYILHTICLYRCTIIADANQRKTLCSC